MPKNIASCAKTPQQRAELGRLVYDLVRAGLDQKGGSEIWWEECERIHRNEWSMDDSLGEGLPPMEVPFSQPRQDMLTAQVCSVLCKQEPYMLATDSGDDEGETLKEMVLHKFWKSAGFENKMRRASNICTDTNRVWYRVGWEKSGVRPFGGLVFDVLHPRHVCLFPATVEGIQGARLVGHRFYRRLREIEALQDAGVYFEGQLIGGDTPEEYDLGREIASAGVTPSIVARREG